MFVFLVYMSIHTQTPICIDTVTVVCVVTRLLAETCRTYTQISTEGYTDTHEHICALLYRPCIQGPVLSKVSWFDPKT